MGKKPDRFHPSLFGLENKGPRLNPVVATAFIPFTAESYVGKQPVVLKEYRAK